VPGETGDMLKRGKVSSWVGVAGVVSLLGLVAGRGVVGPCP
jgi:hypothetical protein